MSVQGIPSAKLVHGDLLTAISDGMIALLKECEGRHVSRRCRPWRSRHQVTCAFARSRGEVPLGDAARIAMSYVPLGASFPLIFPFQVI